MFAIADSASMRWARVMRGTASMASTVALRAARRSISGLFCAGQKNPTSTAPGFTMSASAGVGGRTFRIRSDAAYSDRAPGTMRAPAWMNTSSGKPDSTPAPASTSTSKPSLRRHCTVSGEAATRRSKGAVSFGIPTFIVWGLMFLGTSSISSAGCSGRDHLLRLGRQFGLLHGVLGGLEAAEESHQGVQIFVGQPGVVGDHDGHRRRHALAVQALAVAHGGLDLLGLVLAQARLGIRCQVARPDLAPPCVDERRVGARHEQRVALLARALRRHRVTVGAGAHLR